jgi:hypothetical protein
MLTAFLEESGHEVQVTLEPGAAVSVRNYVRFFLIWIVRI